MSSDFTPFKGRTVAVPEPTRLLRRFTKSGSVVEIRERTVSGFQGIEFIVFVDRSLLESQMFHGRRLDQYAPALELRAKEFSDNGWIEETFAETDEPAS
jgi:hypothetical protein